jgi:hypothetical protein
MFSNPGVSMRRMLHVLPLFTASTTPTLALAAIDRQSEVYQAGYQVGQWIGHAVPHVAAVVAALAALLVVRAWSRRRKTRLDR